MRGNLGDTHGVPSPGGRGIDSVPFPIHDALADLPFARPGGRDVQALLGGPAAPASHAPQASAPSPAAA